MTILVAYDGSRPAQKAVEYAVTHHGDEQLVLLRVIEISSGSIEAGIDLVQEKVKEMREETTETLDEDVAELIKRNKIDFEVETVVGKPSREIVRYAEENQIDSIIIGSHGRKGVSRVLLGNVAEIVVRRSPVTVTVVR